MRHNTASIKAFRHFHRTRAGSCLMIKSMTGFGRAQASVGPFQVTVEMRSVNHRFADFKIRLPSDMMSLEDAMHGRLKKVVQRGRLDVSVNVSRKDGGARSLEINTPLIESYISAAQRIRKRYRLAGELSLDRLLALPDVLRSPLPAQEPVRAEQKAVIDAFDRALAAHDAMRRKEGRILERDLKARMTVIGKLRRRVEKRAPSMLPGYVKRLTTRVQALDGTGALRVDETRVAQEIAIAAEKSDITEELVRLSGYLEQVREMMVEAREPVGKKLDFILQEMNREANTINSKAVDLAICRDALDMKAEVEKIREQVQNIE